MIELGRLQKIETHGGCRALHQFEAEPVDESDLFLWEARLYDFDKSDPLAQDLSKRGLACVTLRIRFPSDFPSQPPFVRVVRPRIKENTGFVLGGGGICMELLTPQGWSPATSLNAVIMSVRSMLLCAPAARLATTARNAREHDYEEDEGRRDAAMIERIHRTHGWTDNKMFKTS
mmetsp:Transcript_37453/g.89904  ORF Transcript_37453/g.89904 Transcript_37453/m.89904 type:complete len:175 (-) Transcript_37453:303-827(-)